MKLTEKQIIYLLIAGIVLLFVFTAFFVAADELSNCANNVCQYK